MATIVESFVGNYLLNKLVAFSEEKIAMILGVKDELNKLQGKIRHIAAYLKDAERRRITDESVTNWLKELKDVMYDFDDMIDLWFYKNQSLTCDEPSSSSNSPPSCCFPLSSCFRSVPVRHEVAKQIQILNSTMEEIINGMKNLNLQHLQSAVQEVGRVDAPSCSSIIDVDVVGNKIKESANKLVQIAITYDKQNINLIAITGMGGIGKTTLAQKIYNDKRIENRYSQKMWLSVTQNYSVAQLIKKAIRAAKDDPIYAESEDELLPILAQVIKGKSFFLVLDDVWNPNSVNSLLNALKTNETYGFILVTTRDQRVALRMGAKYIHQIEVLSTKSAWELLCKKSYLTEATDIRHLEDVGTKIVETCGGLPLAIIAIAGMLSTKNKSKNEWENVLERSAWSIRGLPEEIGRALYLSYEDLSPQLKQCFLICSLYPPNRVMFRDDDLIRFWIAYGFVEEISDPIMENTAEEYYHELIRRNLLEPDHLFPDHSRCNMHDLFRSLAQYLSKEEIFSGDQVFPDHDAITKIRHLSIKEVNEQTFIPDPVTEQLKLRTFVIFDCISKIESHIFTRFEKLRVLHINEEGLHNIPESIGDLIHLRMLDLDRTSISNLPESIGSLTNLLFLNMCGCKLLHTLPRGITRLCNLRQLNLSGTPLTFIPKGLGVLTKLTRISGFQVGGDGHEEDQNGWDLQDIEGLSQLSLISITKLERSRNSSAVLANKTHLKSLFLTFSEVLEMESGHMEELEDEKGRTIVEKLCPPSCLEHLHIHNYRGKMMPNWMSLSSLGDLLPNLMYLQLIGWSCCIDLPPLGLLPNLKYLKVQGASSIVTISSVFLGINMRNDLILPIAFPKLEFLWFIDMPNWEEWVLYDFEGDKSPSWQLMPRIKDLAMENCPKLRALPNGLQQLSTIKRFIVEETHRLKSIQDLTFQCESLEVVKNKCLETLSNLPGVKQLYVCETQNLKQVSKLDSAEYIQLVDYGIESLPEWLVKLMEERKNHSEYKLHLELFCKTTMLEMSKGWSKLAHHQVLLLC